MASVTWNRESPPVAECSSSPENSASSRCPVPSSLKAKKSTGRPGSTPPTTPNCRYKPTSPTSSKHPEIKPSLKPPEASLRPSSATLSSASTTPTTNRPAHKSSTTILSSFARMTSPKSLLSAPNNSGKPPCCLVSAHPPVGAPTSWAL